MSVEDRHVPLERLTAWALVGHAPAEESDRLALSHVSGCPTCANTLARLTVQSDDLRDCARAEADALFSNSHLEQQRTRILDRLAHFGHMARVLPFPARTRAAVLPAARGSRRWMSAAAAGLIIGLMSGQLLHVLPFDRAGDRDFPTVQAPSRTASAVIVPASATTPLLSDDELLDEIEAAVQLRRAQSLRALDALTPTAAEFRDFARPR
jgi:hypothetical protein